MFSSLKIVPPYVLTYSCDLVWDPKAAKEHGIDLDDDASESNVLSNLPHNLKEAAYLLLMEKQFNIKGFKAGLKLLKPTDGSDWDTEKRNTFSQLLFRARKDMNVVAREMNIPMKTCLAYYLGTFKASDEYRLLKTVCCEERLERLAEREHGVDACAICCDGGSLLICDGCEKEYHMTCLRPRLADVPDGDWECDECVAKKFLAVRDFLLEKTKLFQRSPNQVREATHPKRSHREVGSFDEEEEPATIDVAAFMPAEAVVDAG